MTTSLTLACVWVVLAALTAFLPFRAQIIPGLALLIAAAVLLVWIALDHGWAPALLGLLALVSMFRRPLVHLLRRGRGSR